MKKWSYAAAMMLAISSGCIFTGCIDNDEPYGIEQIRVATASLLEAKKAAVEAEAAAANADLEIEKIKAEIAKLEVENQKIINESQAKINEAEAQAKLLAAQAEAAKTQAEADKLKSEAAQYQAQADKVKAETEAYVKDQEATLNEKIALAEINVQTAQLKYDKAVYNFEQKKATNAENANDALWQAVEAAFGSYLWNLDAYNDAVKNHLEAVRKLSALNLDLIWVKNESTGEWEFVSPAYDQKASLENMKAALERQYASEQKKIDLYDGLVAALDGVKETEMYALLEKYQADLEAAELEYQKANADAELVKSDPANQEIFAKEGEIQKQIEALEDEEIEIPGWTYEPIPQLHVLGNDWDQAREVVAEGKYTLKSPADYNNAKSIYESSIQELKGVTYDENDQVWSDASIKELQRNIPSVAEQATRSWNKAKAVYNNGDKVTPEIAEKAPNGVEVQKAAKAFNDLLPSLKTARDAYNAAVVALTKAEEKYDPNASYDPNVEAWGLAQQDWENAQEAWKAVDVEGADKNSQAYKDAQTDYNRAKDNYESAEKHYKPLEDAFNTAYDDLYGKFVDENGVRGRDGGKEKAYNEAKEATEKALTAFIGDDTQSAVGGEIGKQLEEINKYTPSSTPSGVPNPYTFKQNPNKNLWQDLYAFEQDTKNEVKQPEAKIPFAQETNSIYVNAKNYVIYASCYTFGNLENFDHISGAGGSDWDKDLAILLPIDFSNPIPNSTKILNIFNGYLAQQFPTAGPWQYGQWYGNFFGKYAEVLTKLYKLQIGEAYLNNDLNTALQEVLTTPEKNLEDMVAAFDAQNEKLANLEAQKTEAIAAAEALTSDAEAKQEAAKDYRDALEKVVESLQGAVNVMETEAAEPFNENNLAIKNLKSEAEKIADAAKTQQAVLNESIAAIEYQIEKYGDSENGYASLENPYTYYVAYLETKVENAKSLMEFAKARYEELQAKYDAANK